MIIVSRFRRTGGERRQKPEGRRKKGEKDMREMREGGNKGWREKKEKKMMR